MKRTAVCRGASGRARALVRDIGFIRIGERTLASLLKSHLAVICVLAHNTTCGTGLLARGTSTTHVGNTGIIRGSSVVLRYSSDIRGRNSNSKMASGIDRTGRAVHYRPKVEATWSGRSHLEARLCQVLCSYALRGHISTFRN